MLLPLLPHKNPFSYYAYVFLDQNLSTIIMKLRLLFFLFFTMSFQMNSIALAEEMKSRQRIILRDIKSQNSHRSIPILPSAFIEGSLLSIDFLSIVTSVTSTIKNMETGEIIYSSTGSNVTTILIDLTGKSKGKYIIEIQSGIDTLLGEFVFEY